MQMVHSSLTINEAAVDPVPGKSPEDLNMHIASYPAAGWQMASTPSTPRAAESGTTSSGAGRRRARRSRCPAGRIPGNPCRDRVSLLHLWIFVLLRCGVDPQDTR